MTLVEATGHVQAREPVPLGEALGEVLRRDGVEPVLGVQATAAHRDGEDYVLALDDGRELRGDRGTGARRTAVGLALASAVTAALPALIAGLALELAPVRVNLIAPGFVDMPLSASLLGDQLEARRAQLRATLPIRRVVEPDDIAAPSPVLLQVRTL